MERMLRSRHEVAEIQEKAGITFCVGRTLTSNRKRYLQLVRALMKRDLVTLIPLEEVREHAGVFLVEKPGKNS